MTKAQYDVTSHNYDLSKAIYHLSTETWIIPQNDPLFVDLVDTLNQSSLNSYCNNDQISISSSVHYYIRQMAAQCKTWGDIKSTLSSFVGLYYTQSEYNSFIAPYNYWYEHI